MKKKLITADKRILLYLLNYRGIMNRFDIPTGLTQIGIAHETGVSRGYVSRPLNRLLDKGYVQVCVGHTKSFERQHRYYILTDEGKKYARKLERQLSILPISVILSDGSLKKMKLKNIMIYLDKEKFCSDIAEMDIYNNVSKNGTLYIKIQRNIGK